MVLQQFLAHPRWSFPARFVWGTFDAALLLAVLLVANGAASPLVIGYPLLIVAAGLWYHVRFVWYMTALSLASYGVLVLDYYHRRPELQEVVAPSIDRHVTFAVGLVALAAITSYLVQRVRALSGYFGQRL